MHGPTGIFWATLTPFSIQWDEQEAVVTIRQRLTQKKIKTWMDIDGGMKAGKHFLLCCLLRVCLKT
jgi:hypothetical protein